jgi:hypothetical protein
MVSAKLAALQQRLHLIVISQEADEQFRWPVLKDKTQGNIATTLEDLISQLTDSEAAVDVRPAEGVRQLAQRQQALSSFVLR